MASIMMIVSTVGIIQRGRGPGYSVNHYTEREAQDTL